MVPRNRITSTTGLITRTEKSLLFIIPWGSATGSDHTVGASGSGATG